MYIHSHPVFWLILVMIAVNILLKFASKVFLISSRSRLMRLFASSPWMPIREVVPGIEGEEIGFTTKDGQKLHGTWFSCKSGEYRGIILYCHEFNGNRLGAGRSIERLARSGFDVFAMDFRHHGASNRIKGALPTPWISEFEISDVKAAIDYIYSRSDVSRQVRIGIYGLSKGATVALAAAAGDSRINAIVLDSPTPEGRLFEKNCLETLFKRRKYVSTYFSFRFISLAAKALLYMIACPFFALYAAWHRMILGFWCDCRFVNTSAVLKQLNQPILVIHGTNDAFCQSDQVHAFCRRLPAKPSLWVVPEAAHGTAEQTAAEEYDERLVNFFCKALPSNG